MKRVPPSVARRYARALFDVATEKGAEAAERQLRETVALLEGHPELRRALLHPAVSAEKKKKLVSAIWKDPDPLFSRLLNLLIDGDRLSILPELHAAFVDIWNAHRGIVAAEAVSAAPLAPPQEKALADAARQLAGREVSITTSVDPALLGGVLLRMDGRTYDGTIRAKLRALRTRLSEGALSSSSSPRR
jgi:F-type H+-transporting ATPase subunit delta